MSNTIHYMLCLNEEARFLFKNSKQELIRSKCYDFMVYKVMNGNIQNHSDYNSWLEKIEIDENTFGELHLNLCQKIGKMVRSRSL